MSSAGGWIAVCRGNAGIATGDAGLAICSVGYPQSWTQAGWISFFRMAVGIAGLPVVTARRVACRAILDHASLTFIITVEDPSSLFTRVVVAVQDCHRRISSAAAYSMEKSAPACRVGSNWRKAAYRNGSEDDLTKASARLNSRFRALFRLLETILYYRA